MQGTVKWFDKGYGFIISQEGKDVFIHYSNIVMIGFRYLNEDDIVNYELGKGRDGREQAISVVPVLTRKMIEDELKQENLYIKVIKGAHKETRYLVTDQNDAIQTDENGMTFLELAAYAGYEIIQRSA